MKEKVWEKYLDSTQLASLTSPWSIIDRRLALKEQEPKQRQLGNDYSISQ